MTIDSPFALQVEITSRCNLRCRMCPLTTGATLSHAPGHVDDRVWSEVLAMARQATQVFVAGFGEPLTNPRCLELLGELDELGIRVSLVTNGVALSSDVAKELDGLRHLVHLDVSIDTLDPATYRRLRGGSLNRALRGLRAAAGAFSDRSRISVSAVLLDETMAGLESFPPLLGSLGLRHLVVQGDLEYTQYAVAHHPPRGAPLRRALAGLDAACRRHDVELTLSIPERAPLEAADEAGATRRFFATTGPDASRTRQCLLPWEVPYVDKDGRVFPCCYAATRAEACVGDLGESTLGEIWTGPRYETFRRDLLDGTTTPGVCRTCAAVAIGPHPFTRYAASLVPGSLDVAGDRVQVRIRNDGPLPWTGADEIRLGTSSPRDGVSALRHESWLWENRVTGFTEPEVPPGAEATFAFTVSWPSEPASQEFQAVVEHVCWLPGTRFRVDAPPSTSARAEPRRAAAVSG